MGSEPERSAEEFYEQCRSNVAVLDAAARRSAASGDAVVSLALAWAADVHATQGVLGERVLGAAAGTRRRLFGAAEALMRGLRGAPIEIAAGPGTVASAIRTARRGLLSGCDDLLASALEQAWSDVAYLDELAAPTVEELERAAEARCDRMSPGSFVTLRRHAAVEQMALAQSLRVRSQLPEAVQAAYEADFLGLEAYLVESAVAAGDAVLLSVVARWELASASVAALPGLPSGFLPAVHRIRRAMGAALPEAEAVRLLASLPPVG